MHFTYGNVSLLEGKDWYTLEFGSKFVYGPSDTVSVNEQDCRRLIQSVPGIFKDQPCEIVVPVVKWDYKVFDLVSGPFVYVRGDLRKLLRFRAVFGFSGLITSQDSGRISDVIAIEDSYVQDIIAVCKRAHKQRSAGIHKGTFVRIVDGQWKDFCGHVVGSTRDICIVEVSLETKTVTVTTNRTNLLNLGAVPKDKQVFYYHEAI